MNMVKCEEMQIRLTHFLTHSLTYKGENRGKKALQKGSNPFLAQSEHAKK